MSVGLRVEQLSRRFADLEAVKGITFDVFEGETFGLLGPNGAGKTTTLSMLSTLIPSTQGDATVFGHSLANETHRVRPLVGLAPQQISLYPELTAAENLAFFGRLYGVSGPTLRERSLRLLEDVGLTARRHDRIATYSGGMRRRLNLACSLIHEPRLLLLDEPTAGVDPHSRENIVQAIQEIAASGTSVIYTTHYMEEAEQLCDRIAILDEGKIVALGTLEELLAIVGMGEVIEIRGAGAMADRFHSLPTVSKVETREDVTQIWVESAARSLPGIGALLADEGAEVRGLEIHSVNLERVFLYLTGKNLRD